MQYHIDTQHDRDKDIEKLETMCDMATDYEMVFSDDIFSFINYMSGQKLMDQIFEKTTVTEKGGKKIIGATLRESCLKNLEKAREAKRIKQEKLDAELKVADPALYEKRVKAREGRKIACNIRLKKQADEAEVAENLAEIVAEEMKEEPEPKSEPKVLAGGFVFEDGDMSAFVGGNGRNGAYLQDTMKQKAEPPKRTLYNPLQGKGSLF